MTKDDTELRISLSPPLGWLMPNFTRRRWDGAQGFVHAGQALYLLSLNFHPHTASSDSDSRVRGMCSKDGLFFFFFFSFVLVLVLFVETGFLCSLGACPGTSFGRSGWPRTHRDPPASSFQVVGLKACATTAWLGWLFQSVYISHWLRKLSTGPDPGWVGLNVQQLAAFSLESEQRRICHFLAEAAAKRFLHTALF